MPLSQRRRAPVIEYTCFEVERQTHENKSNHRLSTAVCLPYLEDVQSDLPLAHVVDQALAWPLAPGLLEVHSRVELTRLSFVRNPDHLSQPAVSIQDRRCLGNRMQSMEAHSATTRRDIACPHTHEVLCASRQTPHARIRIQQCHLCSTCAGTCTFHAFMSHVKCGPKNLLFMLGMTYSSDDQEIEFTAGLRRA